MFQVKAKGPKKKASVAILQINKRTNKNKKTSAKNYSEEIGDRLGHPPHTHQRQNLPQRAHWNGSLNKHYLVKSHIHPHTLLVEDFNTNRQIIQTNVN